MSKNVGSLKFAIFSDFRILPSQSSGRRHYRLRPTKSRKYFFAKFFRSFLATGAPPCTKQKVGEIEISLLPNFQLRTTLGAQKKKRKIAETAKIFVRIDENQRFPQVLEDLGKIWIHCDAPHDFLL